jgi:aminopeptidase N
MLRLFASWFGKPAQETLAVVVDSGTPTDSMPGVVYAPPVTIAGYSSLQSQVMVRSGGRGRGVPAQARTVLDEAFARGVALQWWGNTVTPASFHDAWLSNGFANFSGSLYDSAANNPDDYKEHWVTAHRTLMSPNEHGIKPNDAGPVWMGLLNETFKTERSSGALITLKGGYILHMLRSLMWDAKTGDGDFRAMMQDYVTQFANQAATTRDFQTVVEKHMKPSMDLARNHRMDWFFVEWLFGTDVPSYRMEYTLTPDPGGKTLLTVKLAQSGVSPSFAMPVPVYGEFHGKMRRLATAAMVGNGSGEFKVQLPEVPKRIVLNLNHDVLTDHEEVKRK